MVRATARMARSEENFYFPARVSSGTVSGGSWDGSLGILLNQTQEWMIPTTRMKARIAEIQ
jgi:hypothetical protein